MRESGEALALSTPRTATREAEARLRSLQRLHGLWSAGGRPAARRKGPLFRTAADATSRHRTQRRQLDAPTAASAAKRRPSSACVTPGSPSSRRTLYLRHEAPAPFTHTSAGTLYGLAREDSFVSERSERSGRRHDASGGGSRTVDARLDALNHKMAAWTVEARPGMRSAGGEAGDASSGDGDAPQGAASASPDGGGKSRRGFEAVCADKRAVETILVETPPHIRRAVEARASLEGHWSLELFDEATHEAERRAAMAKVAEREPSPRTRRAEAADRRHKEEYDAKLVATPDSKHGGARRRASSAAKAANRGPLASAKKAKKVHARSDFRLHGPLAPSPSMSLLESGLSTASVGSSGRRDWAAARSVTHHKSRRLGELEKLKARAARDVQWIAKRRKVAAERWDAELARQRAAAAKEAELRRPGLERAAYVIQTRWAVRKARVERSKTLCRLVLRVWCEASLRARRSHVARLAARRTVERSVARAVAEERDRAWQAAVRAKHLELMNDEYQRVQADRDSLLGRTASDEATDEAHEAETVSVAGSESQADDRGEASVAPTPAANDESTAAPANDAPRTRLPRKPKKHAWQALNAPPWKGV